MNPYIVKIRRMAKKIIAYSMEGEEKVYRIRHTPFQIKRRYTRRYHRKWEHLPVQSNKVIFDNYMGKGYGCNGKYVTEALLEMDTDLDIVWTVQDPAKQKELFPDRVRLVRYGSSEAMREYATAGVWAGNYQMVHYLNQGLLKKPNQIYIQMWHGSFGIKKIENDCKNLTQDKNWTTLAKRSSQYTDFWISNSSFETAVYRQAFWDVGQVLEFGHPRNDIFFNGRDKQARDKVERYIGKRGHRLLLYVPTFRDAYMDWEQPLDTTGLTGSLKARFGGDWLVLKRLHPRIASSTQAVRQETENCVNVTAYPDIQELLAAADVVITDYSSAVFDFLLTGRPAFLYASDYDSYQQMRGLYYPLSETPFAIAADNQSLWENIKAFDETAYRDKVHDFLAGKGSVENGDAAKRTAELIVRCAAQNRQK